MKFETIQLYSGNNQTYFGVVKPELEKITFTGILSDTVPKGMSIIEIKYDENNLVTNLDVVYDPFDVQKNSYRFLGWLEKTPETRPLYIYQENCGTLISDKPQEKNKAKYPVVYVLDEKYVEKYGEKHGEKYGEKYGEKKRKIIVIIFLIILLILVYVILTTHKKMNISV